MLSFIEITGLDIQRIVENISTSLEIRERHRDIIYLYFREMMNQEIEILGAEINRATHAHAEVANLLLCQIASGLTRRAIYLFQKRAKKMLTYARQKGGAFVDIGVCFDGALDYAFREFQIYGIPGVSTLGNARYTIKHLVEAGILKWKGTDAAVAMGTGGNPVSNETSPNSETAASWWKKFFNEIEAMTTPIRRGSAPH